MVNKVKQGDVFGRLTVISERYKKQCGYVPYYVQCQCECGTIREIQSRSLTQSKNPTRSCGCLQKESARNQREFIEIGERFGRLTVRANLPVVDRKTFVLANCDCGSKDIRIRLDQLKNGHTKSCGCLQKECVVESLTTHGLTGSGVHTSWTSMKQRCSNPNSRGYSAYGGRGITYDPKWETFEGFFEDMGECPEGMSLDRIDVNGNYSKENCRWVSDTVQIHNQRKRKNNRNHQITSKFRGVYYDKNRDKWQARLMRDGKTYLNKRFETEIQAAQAYDKVSFEVYGDRPNEELGLYKN